MPTRQWVVIHHGNCGMELFTDDVMRRLLASSLETAPSIDGYVYQVESGKRVELPEASEIGRARAALESALPPARTLCALRAGPRRGQSIGAKLPWLK